MRSAEEIFKELGEHMREICSTGNIYQEATSGTCDISKQLEELSHEKNIYRLIYGLESIKTDLMILTKQHILQKDEKYKSLWEELNKLDRVVH